MAKNFMCDLCKKRYRTEQSTLQHIKDFHPKPKRPAIVVDLTKMRSGCDEEYMSEAEYEIERIWGTYK